ncbi:hypothetical protein Lsha_1466 [Legionella shakespearei DSM 23087]|uniref:Uncharacterized protein n=1 Tax=Legionella shakespearei DSM 23087 TaxID=1122169 RepID=A0A0W0YV36_9GAMM|nr:hypothetical protein Lsha_1466 [Legionella shakespearei DSM 23087]
MEQIRSPYCFVTPSDPRRPERVFLREGSPGSGIVPIFGDPSRKKTRSGRRSSGRGAGMIIIIVFDDKLINRSNIQHVLTIY